MRKLLAIFLVLNLILISCSYSYKIDKCKELEKDQKDECYFEIASSGKDISLCEKIQDRNLAVNCVLLIDNNEKNIDECKNMKSSILKDACLRAMPVEQKDVSICESIEELRSRAICFEEVGIDKNDPSICEKINEQWEGSGVFFFREVKYECLTKISIQKQDASICNKINFPPNRDTCIELVKNS